MPLVRGKLRHLAVSENTLAREVRAALVDTLYSSPASLVIGAICGSVVAGCIAWLHGSTPLLICSIAIHFVGASRAISAFLYRRAAPEAATGSSLPWERIYEIGAWLYASLLGLLTFLVIVADAPTLAQVMAVSLSTGYAAGIAGRNAGRPVIAIGQLCLAALPMTFGLFIVATPVAIVLGVIHVFFVMGIIDIALNTYEVVFSALSSKNEKAETAARFEKMARCDMLTGLDNRLAMQMRLSDLLDEVSDETRPLAIIWMDLDHFKAINDSLGHLAGDKVLIVTTQRVKAVIGERGWLARFGGDEFVIMAFVEGPEDAEALAGEILSSISQPVSVNDQTIEVSASLGVALAPQDGRQSDAILKRADIALYHAKNDGRNKVRRFEPFMHEDFLLHRQIEQGLSTALAESEFELVFQPIVELATGRTVSCEALLRWTHPELGPVSPAVFIPIAESAGLIGAITDWVIREACLAAAGWPAEVKVSVNISPALLKQQNLPITIIETLVNTGMVARRLELEITESVLLDKSPQTNSLLRQLQKMGLKLCLDDFGTGFSSLTYLRSWDFDTIKIDKSFIKNIEHSPTDQKIIRAVVQLARSLDVATVAEGVETASQLAHVERAGCSRVQGFYYAKPMSGAKIAARLAEQDGGKAPRRSVSLR
ncbi:MAG: EAL domain-containing protein [Sphingomonadaceae bacterium]|nr:EAL domain-containing protein [Sphingomonadaceae bacterium]